MCEVVDSRSANKASTETQNKDFTYLNRHGDSNMTITRQIRVKHFVAGYFFLNLNTLYDTRSTQSNFRQFISFDTFPENTPPTMLIK